MNLLKKIINNWLLSRSLDFARDDRNKKGETITETIIALSILAIGITLSSTLMASSLRNINVSKNRFIAVNIAREGIEAMRNIRDTNWLKFSSSRRTCWNHSPQADPATDNCIDVDSDGVSDNAIELGDYIIYKDEDHRWRLADATTGSAPVIDHTPLFTVDIDEDGESDMYNHSPDLISDALGTTPQPTVFKRKITIEYLQDDGTEGDVDNNRMRVTSAVSWFRSGIERTVELKTHLTDYLGRDNLQN